MRGSHVRVSLFWRFVRSPAGAVALATAFSALAYGTLVLHKQAVFGTQAFDLGIFDQGVWLLSRFKNPYVTLRGLNLFADHASWILLLVAPLYWIWADVRVLLLLGVVAVAAGGPMLYAIARTEGVRKPLAAGLAVAYLLHPAVGWNVWDVFHPEVLAIPLLIAAYLFAVRRRVTLAGLMLLLVLLIKEDAALVVVPFALYFGWRFKAWRVTAVVIGTSFAMFAFDFWYALPHLSPTGALIYTSRYGEFGNSMTEIIRNVVVHPGKVLSLLATSKRLIYLASMLLPLFLSLLAPEVLLIAAPVTLANLLSLHGYQSEINYHYTAYMMAVVAIAAIHGASRLDRERLSRSLVPAVLIAGILGMLFAGPLPDNGGPWGGSTSNPQAINDAIALIPDDASVSADWYISPHMSHRTDIYMYTNPFIRDYWSADEAPGPPPDAVDWVIIEAGTPGNGGGKTADALAMIEADPHWQEVVANDYVLVYHKVD